MKKIKKTLSKRLVGKILVHFVDCIHYTRKLKKLTSKKLVSFR